MRLSNLFTKTSRDLPRDEVSKNAQLLIQAGYIHKEMAGAYNYLPLGLRVIERVKQIVREEMDAIGGNEMLMTTLQRKELWEKTDRWDEKKVDIWFKTQLQSGKSLGLGWSHEEPITEMMRSYLSSYKDLPAYVYQFQNKLRNELRAKSGIMRGREFIMKDLYSYSQSEDEHQKFYEAATDAYHKCYARLGIGDDTFFTYADGGAFTDFSHEFQTICDAGEDTIFLSRDKKLAINEEVLNDEVLSNLGLQMDELEKVNAAEVGNIFSFGDVKSKELDLFFTDNDGARKPVILGSYGIGITRVIGVIVEKMSDENGLVWPEQIAPAKAHIVRIGDDEAVVGEADKLYTNLNERGVEVLYDDRNLGVGEMLKDADLLGIPLRVVVSKKSMEQGGLEIKKRTENDASTMSSEELLGTL